MTKKPRVLLFLRLPPRLTGATLMNSFVYESELLKENFNIKTLRVPHAKSHDTFGEKSVKKLTGIIATQFKLFFTLLTFRPKFVYFQISPLGGAFLRDFLFVAVIKMLRTRILYHMHGKGIAKEQNRKYFKKLYKFVFKKEQVICLSNSLTQDIADVYNGTPYIVPNVIKRETINFPERELDKPLKILFVSNLFIFKGIHVFIDALELLNNKNISFEAHIVGSEAEETEISLSSILTNKGLADTVKYLGPKFDSEKWEEYKWANVLVFPTLNDIWGLVILEAMQAGIPVIASIDGAIPEIIDDNKTGFLVEQGNAQQICNKLEYLHNNRDKLKNMGEQGKRKFNSTYAYEQFEINMLNTFKKACN